MNGSPGNAYDDGDYVLVMHAALEGCVIRCKTLEGAVLEFKGLQTELVDISVKDVFSGLINKDMSYSKKYGGIVR
jgi:hypothetical protein